MAAILALVVVGYWTLQSPSTPNISQQATPSANEAKEISLSILPEKVEQGDPALVVVNGTTTVKWLKLNNKELETFIHNGKLSALVGFDLRGSVGAFPLELELYDGEKIESKLVVGERYIAKAPLGIPEKLGGDTPQSEQNLINTLVEEGRLISAVPSAGEKLWAGEFILPLKGEIVVTDTYGYSRLTGASTISHKGTDYRAAVGTPIYAMNSGRVVFTRELRNYGKTIIIDHGLGLHTIYMHLSEIQVSFNQSVDKGQLIGKSGDTGYVLGPHLHLTIRINGVSIDPERFIALFNAELR